ncbi:uncharacterized protein UTRI_00508 [Ustilago trichophora]|uniref:Uncharacterized protein n=1 Tax=Ustilago trichophora TaxID=86804 RepID=A0A5C3DV18_9BASI|nr:uncharacterized protein UTRI_00508 [Ustilago trichophora]
MHKSLDKSDLAAQHSQDPFVEHHTQAVAVAAVAKPSAYKDASGRTSEDTIYSCASSFSEDSNIPSFGFGEKPASLDLLPVIEPLHVSKRVTFAPASTPAASSLPPPRPSRSIRPPRHDLPPVPATIMKKSPQSQYCYDPFVEYEAQRSSLESTRSCGRADSIDLDPDLDNEAAREFQAGLYFARQALEPGASASADHLAPPSRRTFPLYRELHGTTSSDYYEDVGCGSLDPFPARLPGTLAPCASYTTLASAFSSGSSEEGNHDAKMRRRARTPTIRAGKALISSAIKKLSASAVVSTAAASIDSQLTINTIRLRRPVLSKADRPSFKTAPAVSALRRSVESDTDSSPESSAPSITAASPASSSLRTISPSHEGRSASSRAGSEAQREREFKDAQREREFKDAQREIKDALPATTPAHKNHNVTDESHVHLPSYHRGLRKQLYPPRVRYEIRQGLSLPTTRQPSPPTTPGHYAPRVRFSSGQYELRGPRQAFDSGRIYSMG